MEEIVKEVLDMSKMPQDIQNDPFKKESWIADENGRIEQEYAEKLAAQNQPNEPSEPIEPQEPEEKTVFSFDDFKEYGEFKTVDELKAELKIGRAHV